MPPFFCFGEQPLIITADSRKIASLVIPRLEKPLFDDIGARALAFVGLKLISLRFARGTDMNDESTVKRLMKLSLWVIINARKHSAKLIRIEAIRAREILTVVYSLSYLGDFTQYANNSLLNPVFFC